MKFWPKSDRPAKGLSVLGRFLSVAAVMTSTGVGVLGVTEVAAHASAGAAYELLISNSSWLNIAVRGGSTTPGTDIIQWWSDGGNEQRWNSITYNGYDSWFQNVQSGFCITTDGVAGDPLTQEVCSANDPYQEWVSSYVWWTFGYTLYNPASGLDMDVQNDSYWGGAEIDAWYPNNQVNQSFSTPGGGSLG
jgi:hypothetical protein